ncbi:hypothetical protein [Nonomuraea sp. NPDC050310]|uniref:hypothetical protein n=1 Tax=Nonomuraea sp. NPDC050310 TaxID=3154935 RepID=UPI0033DE7E03
MTGSIGGSGGRWLVRDDLAAAAGTATGLLLASPDAGSVVTLSPADHELTAAALTAAGVGPADRVVVALAEPAGALWASAAAEVAAAAAAVGPRGRLRLQHLLTTLRATTLVTTPTGAMDLLARLHLEFLLDPLDLGLRQIVVTGEIAAPHTLAHLAAEFEATVTEVYASPFSGAALAWRSAAAEPLTPLCDGLVRHAALAKDEFAAEGRGELVLVREDAVLRTGQVAAQPGAAPAHTVGEHLLVRGVWLSLPRLDKALARIDGVAAWDLTVSRPGTLDVAVLTVRYARAGLVGNPMWKARVEQALQALTPVRIAVEIDPEVAPRGAGVVTDLRGQHLGRDRALV